MNVLAIVPAVVAGALLAACGGGGGYGGGYTAPAVTTTSTQQVITMSMPTSVIGVETDPVFGVVAGYTEQVYSQTLAFVPNAQVMISNGESSVTHTLNVLSQTAFPANPTLSSSAAGGTTLAAGYASGIVTPTSQIGPVTLTAGVYYIGCAFHYISNNMRTVLTVAAAATPGPQATPVPGDAAPVNGYGY